MGYDEDNDSTADGLAFSELRRTSVERCALWHGGTFVTMADDSQLVSDWSAADWSNAAAGEMGELANVIKKIRRQQTGMRGSVDPDMHVLLDQAADELADTVIYLDLVAAFLGIDLGAAIRRKFNAISEREGFEQTL